MHKIVGVRMVKCFVTGGKGFIGNHIVRLLTEKDHSVDVLVRKTSHMDLIQDLPVSKVAGDVTDMESMARGTSDDTEWFFHNAARMSEWGGKKRNWPINVEGTRNALEVARRKDIPRFIYTSSTAVYGFPGEPMAEDSPKKPYESYQKSKLAAEELVWEYSQEYGIRATAVRPPTVVGYGDMYLGPTLIDALKAGTWMYLDGGSNRQSIVHAEDVARCLILAAERFEMAHGNAYNVTSFIVEMRVLIEALADELGVPKDFRSVPYRAALAIGKATSGLFRAFHRKDSPFLTGFRVKYMGSDYVIDDSKVRHELGYQPKWSLEATVRDMVEWGGEFKPR
ncbi:MAG: NAD-dependent epimerase/dehydratase family protein [Candidatus Thorarchaeota archaeon]|nr:MAG: NAD-dependent epimerase/dehydratase family protein [Candidatus Thorarchaeota archaeon]